MFFLTAVLILLVISAFFSAAETAMTAASRPLMHRLAATVNHPQMPAYYDQILGQYTFAPRR